MNNTEPKQQNVQHICRKMSPKSLLTQWRSILFSHKLYSTFNSDYTTIQFSQKILSSFTNQLKKWLTAEKSPKLSSLLWIIILRS